MDSPFEVGRPGHAEREFDSKDPLDAIACRARDWLLMAAHCRSVRRAGNFREGELQRVVRGLVRVDVYVVSKPI
jgi:hypothetical protein